MTKDIQNQIEHYEDSIEILRNEIMNLKSEKSDLEHDSDYYVTGFKFIMFLSLVSIFVPFVWILVILLVVVLIVDGYKRYKQRKEYKKWIDESYEQLRYYQNELHKIKFGKSVS